MGNSVKDLPLAYLQISRNGSVGREFKGFLDSWVGFLWIHSRVVRSSPGDHSPAYQLEIAVPGTQIPISEVLFASRMNQIADWWNENIPPGWDLQIRADDSCHRIYITLIPLNPVF